MNGAASEHCGFDLKIWFLRSDQPRGFSSFAAASTMLKIRLIIWISCSPFAKCPVQLLATCNRAGNSGNSFTTTSLITFQSSLSSQPFLKAGSFRWSISKENLPWTIRSSCCPSTPKEAWLRTRKAAFVWDAAIEANFKQLELKGGMIPPLWLTSSSLKALVLVSPMGISTQRGFGMLSSNPTAAMFEMSSSTSWELSPSPSRLFGCTPT